jgi:hypothetical protein
MKVILTQKEWLLFLKSNPDIYNSLWDLIPKEMEVHSIEEVVYAGRILYILSYMDRTWMVWTSEIEEIHNK